jgi:DNA-binding LytR/AlgR family response regulator
LIKVGTTVQKILVDDIRYVESEKRKNIIHMEKETLTYYGSMEELEQTLAAVQVPLCRVCEGVYEFFDGHK